MEKQNMLLAQSVIDDILKSMELLRSQREDEALGILQDMSPAVKSLRAMADRMCVDAKQAENANQKLLDDVLVLLGKTKAAEEGVKTEIERVRTQIAGEQSLVATDRETIVRRESEINALQVEIDNIRRRFQEAEDNWWVPGYNFYLAGRTIGDEINGKISRIRTAQEELDRLRREEATTVDALDKVSLDLTMSVAQADELAQKETSLEAQEADLENRNVFYSQRVTFASNLALYYSNLDVALDSVGNNLDSVVSLAARLNEPMQIYTSKGEVIDGTVKDALLLLALESNV